MYNNNMYYKWVDVRGQRVSGDKGFEVTGHYQWSLSRPPQLTEECGPSLATMLSVALSKYPRALLRLPSKSPALQKLCSSQAAAELDGLFTTDEFVSRHIGPRDHDQTAMLDVLGFKVRYNILHLPFSNQSTEAGVTFWQRENYCLSLQCETADHIMTKLSQ